MRSYFVWGGVYYRGWALEYVNKLLYKGGYVHNMSLTLSGLDRISTRTVLSLSERVLSHADGHSSSSHE